MSKCCTKLFKVDISFLFPLGLIPVDLYPLQQLLWSDLFFITVFISLPIKWTHDIYKNVSNTQILISKYYSPLKETKGPWWKDWSQGWSGENIKWNQNIFLCQKVENCPKNDGSHVKEHRAPFDRALAGHIWENVNMKIKIIDYNPLNKISLHWCIQRREEGGREVRRRKKKLL